MRTDDQQIPIFCLKKAIAQAIPKPLGAIEGIVGVGFMVICSSEAVSNYVQMVGKSACVFYFLNHKFFYLSPYHVAEWISSLSVYSLE